jgi:xylulokinase
MYLGLDLGTSSLKALLIDDNQHILGSASAPLTVERPHHGWSEQDPDSWIDATRAALAELGKTHASENWQRCVASDCRVTCMARRPSTTTAR